MGRGVTSRVATVTRLCALEVKAGLGVTLCAGHINVGALLGKLRVALLVVVEVESRLRRLPGNLRMAALALHKRLAIKAVGLIALVAASTELVFAKVEATTCLVLLLVAILALKDLVFVAKRPACQFVIEALFLALDRSPTHHVEASALVIEVAVLAVLPPHFGGGVVALAGSNSLFQIVVVVTVEALVAVDALAVVDVAIVAAILVIESSVLFGQRAGAGRKEVTLGLCRTLSDKAQKQGKQPSLGNRETSNGKSSAKTSHNNKQILQRLCKGQVNMNRRDCRHNDAEGHMHLFPRVQ